MPPYDDSYGFCLNHVKKYDHENYLAGLCIKDPHLRRISFALRAFNVELSLVRDLTTNSDRAKIRFHFWSKLIDEIVRRNADSGAAFSLEKDVAYYRQTPVAKEMLDLFAFVQVTSEIESLLRDLIGARISSKVLGYKQFDTMDELELYCVKSNSSIYQLAWRLDSQFKGWQPRGSDQDLVSVIETISKDLGKAQGLSNVIRGIPYNSTKNCCYIPRELIETYGLSSVDFTARKLDGRSVRPVVEHLASRCRTVLDGVYSNLSRLLSSSNRYHYRHLEYLFLSRVPIESSLKRLKRCGYNICEPSMGRRNTWLALNLKLASIYYKAPIL